MSSNRDGGVSIQESSANGDVPAMTLRDRKGTTGSVLGDITNISNTTQHVPDKPGARTRRQSADTARSTSIETDAPAQSSGRSRRSTGGTSTENTGSRSPVAKRTRRSAGSANENPAAEATVNDDKSSGKRMRRSSGGVTENEAPPADSTENQRDNQRATKRSRKSTESVNRNDESTEADDENMPPAQADENLPPAPAMQRRGAMPPTAPVPPEPVVNATAPLREACASSSSSVGITTSIPTTSSTHTEQEVAQNAQSAENAERPFHVPNPRLRRLPLVTKAADPAKCLDRIDDMYELFYEQESLFMVRPYMERQNDINKKMRGILVDWLVDVHHRFQLQPLTLWLTVNILDRFLMEVHVVRSRLQLVGVSAMFIACKYEEMYPPVLNNYVRVTDFAYERQEVLEMEKQILIKLNYNIFVPTGYHFLSRYLNSINASDHLRHLASYYAERNLQEYDSLLVEPHKMAAASMLAAMQQQEETLGNFTNDYASLWRNLEIETGCVADDLVPYARIMIRHVSEEPPTASGRRLLACKRKFSKCEYNGVSSLALPVFYNPFQ